MRSALVVCYTQFATKHPLFYIWEDVGVDWELHYIQEFFRNCKNIDTDVRNDKKKNGIHAYIKYQRIWVRSLMYINIYTLHK